MISFYALTPTLSMSINALTKRVSKSEYNAHFSYINGPSKKQNFSAQSLVTCVFRIFWNWDALVVAAWQYFSVKQEKTWQAIGHHHQFALRKRASAVKYKFQETKYQQVNTFIGGYSKNKTNQIAPPCNKQRW